MYLFPVWEIVVTFMAYFTVNWWHPVFAWSGSVSSNGSWSLFWINTKAQILDCSRSNEVYVSLSPWETNQQVCFSHKLWSRLEKAYFFEEKSEVENLSPFWHCCLRAGGASVPRRCQHGQVYVVSTKEDTLGGLEKKARLFQFQVPRAGKAQVSGWLPCWLLKLLWKFRIGPLPHSLLAGSLFFSRSFHRTVISPNSAFYLFIYFWPGCASCRISVFRPGSRSLPPARNCSVWTTGPQERSLSYNSFLRLSRSFLLPLGTGAEPFENLSFLCDW